MPTEAGLGTPWKTGADEKDRNEFGAEHKWPSRTPGQFPHAKVEEGILTDWSNTRWVQRTGICDANSS